MGRTLTRRRRTAASGRKGPPQNNTSDACATATVACWLMIGVGAAVWLGFTHLVGRFAVVLIVPCAVVLGRSWPAAGKRSTTGLGVAAVVVLLAVNMVSTVAGFKAARVFAVSSVLNQEGRDGLAWFTGGHWPGQAHVPRLNALADAGQKVLMVGDARRFYLNRSIDYCVVFNRNPFAEAAATLSPAELIRWLKDRGYTYLYVDWGEMERLRGSRYGFWPSLDALLFQRLMDAGLRPVDAFSYPDRAVPYATLFALAGDGRL